MGFSGFRAVEVRDTWGFNNRASKSKNTAAPSLSWGDSWCFVSDIKVTRTFISVVQPGDPEKKVTALDVGLVFFPIY